MKKILIQVAILIFVAITTMAQAPQAFNYQGIARNSSGSPLASTTIGLRLTIHEASSTGTSIYQETFTPTTNAYGLYNVAVGQGAVVSGTFTGINWSSAAMYLQVEIDPAGGTTYTSLGANELLSVPYALYAGGTGTGTANYLPKFNTATALGNSVIYQSGLNLGIGTTTPVSTLTVASSTDSEVLFIGQAGTPTPYGSERIQYNGPADVPRTSLLSTTIRTTVDSLGIGLEGAGAQAGIDGIGESSTSSQVVGSEGDAYGANLYAIGMDGFGFGLGTSPQYSIGVYGTGSGGLVNYGMYSNGDMLVAGTLSKFSGTFKIDHPLDPANKYLYHSFVESPDMMNIYNGNITTDASGVAEVTLPDYFDALNKDFRYQLTVLGASFAQAIVSKEITGNTFEIKTSLPNTKVSWQVTGVRQDAWANAHRVVPEVEKESFNKGKYLTPKEEGRPENLKIGGDIKAQPKSDNILSAQKANN